MCCRMSHLSHTICQYQFQMMTDKKGVIEFRPISFNAIEMDKRADRVTSLPFPQSPLYVTSTQIHKRR